MKTEIRQLDLGLFVFNYSRYYCLAVTVHLTKFVMIYAIIFSSITSSLYANVLIRLHINVASLLAWRLGYLARYSIM